MNLFPFPYHTPTHVYPKGDAVQFGNGYQFAAKPQLPFQRTFKLHFNAMKWEMGPDGVTPDATIRPETNLLALIKFYEAHDTSQMFVYPHPAFGNLVVRFSSSQPFETPRSLDGGSGVTDAFDLYVVEQPGIPAIVTDPPPVPPPPHGALDLTKPDGTARGALVFL